jgi:hypothetical protein
VTSSSVNPGVAQAAGALLMAITAAHHDESGDAIPQAVAGVFAERIDGLVVDTTECGGSCPAVDRAAEGLGAEFGAIIAGQLTLQIALLARLCTELDRDYEDVLREVLDTLPA